MYKLQVIIASLFTNKASLVAGVHARSFLLKFLTSIPCFFVCLFCLNFDGNSYLLKLNERLF